MAVGPAQSVTGRVWSVSRLFTDRGPMALPAWSEVRESLTAAITAALPLQLRKAAGERISGLGVHMDAYYGSAGLYLLPESAARRGGARTARNIGDWPISTDWD